MNGTSITGKQKTVLPTNYYSKVGKDYMFLFSYSSIYQYSIFLLHFHKDLKKIFIRSKKNFIEVRFAWLLMCYKRFVVNDI